MIFNKIQTLKANGKRIGITFSQFDLLHAGHIAMLAEAKNHCDYLIAGLQNNATWDRAEKNAPVQSIVERQIQLAATRYVDEIVVYNTEKDLEDLLLILPVDVRILGVEYQDKEFTGRNICTTRGIELVFNSRDHSFSSSNLRKRIVEASAGANCKVAPIEKAKTVDSKPVWQDATCDVGGNTTTGLTITPPPADWRSVPPNFSRVAGNYVK